MFTPSRDDIDRVSAELLTSDAAVADGLAGSGVKDASAAGDDAVPVRSARKRRRNACGVAADSCGEGLTLGVVLRELLKSH